MLNLCVFWWTKVSDTNLHSTHLFPFLFYICVRLDSSSVILLHLFLNNLWGCTWWASSQLLQSVSSIGWTHSLKKMVFGSSVLFVVVVAVFLLWTPEPSLIIKCWPHQTNFEILDKKNSDLLWMLSTDKGHANFPSRHWLMFTQWW